MFRGLQSVFPVHNLDTKINMWAAKPRTESKLDRGVLAYNPSTLGSGGLRIRSSSLLKSRLAWAMGDSASNIKELSWEASQPRTELHREFLPSGEKSASCVVSFLTPLSYERASPRSCSTEPSLTRFWETESAPLPPDCIPGPRAKSHKVLENRVCPLCPLTASPALLCKLLFQRVWRSLSRSWFF